ncbi:Uncharacterised protein [Burkholderia pseudomallei]|uniref:hypothetical protein n=1 Tax=Burkholderia pseudomallei TaxID=28450 RepID=UPI000F06B038|nr:hypothetical protein [Burkholderia pseudomallei]CAJ3005192.1 Uncharacterised protein [Burkholderia pseudomallei]
MTTTDNSRADALTDDQFEDWLLPLLIKHLDSKARHYLTREQVRDGIEVTRVTTYAMNLARAILGEFPASQPAAAPIDEVTCARMGHGVVAIGDCFSPELQEPGIIFMELPEQRDIGLDTGDVFPEGSRAPSDKVLAYISFANPNAIDQTISVLQRIKAKHFPVPSPADERTASWYCCDPVQICSAQCDSCAKQARAALKAIVDERAECIAWANANGFTKYHESMCAAWEERARRAAQQLSAEIRELKVKLGSYEREREDQTRYLAAQSEEIADLKYQLAHADARVWLTATVIQKCIDSCAAEYLEDVTGHPEDAAYCQGITDCIDALNRLKTADWSVILAAHSGQSEPETATVARIERLRKALFESRDAMRVMSNWAKKPDPAGHSWAVRMLDRANAALNGEPEPRSELTVSRCFRCGHADHAGPCVNVHPDLAARAGDAENDYARFRSIAEDLKEGGNHVASEAIDELLTSAISAHDAKQEAARHAKRITELEAALEMVRGIRYQEMRLHLPEGGHVSLRWPESMSLESAEMLREVFDLQMKAHAKYMANRVTAPEADAARTGASS